MKNANTAIILFRNQGIIPNIPNCSQSDILKLGDIYHARIVQISDPMTRNNKTNARRKQKTYKKSDQVIEILNFQIKYGNISDVLSSPTTGIFFKKITL